MSTRRAAQKAETRQRILEEAAALFAGQGYEVTTTRQIAEKSGVSIGTVFAHFPNKLALLQAVLLEGIERALERARKKLDATTDVGEAMALFAGSLYRFYVDRRELSRELVKHSLFDVRDLTDQLLRFRQEIAALLGRSPELTKGGMHPDVVVDTLFSHYFFVLLVLLNDDGLSVHKALQQLRRMNALVLGRR